MIANYTTSSNYKLLWDMVNKRKLDVICLLNYYGQEDVALVTPPRLPHHTFTQVSSRGCVYISSKFFEDFEKECQDAKLRWVVPELSTKAPAPIVHANSNPCCEVFLDDTP